MVKHTHKRWLIVTQYFPPEIGAAQIRLRSLARELLRNGIEVAVLTGMPNYPAGKTFSGYENRWYLREKVGDIPVRRVWLYPGTGKSALIRLLNYLSFTISALVAVFFVRRPDVLFIESQPISLGIIGLLMKWLRGVPFVYNVPDLQVDAARQMGFIKNETFLKIAWHLENLFLKQSWKVSTVTNRFITHFQERGIPREQITFLPNGADTEFLRPKPPADDLLKRWNLPGKKVFVYVGTHAIYHGLDTLVRAAHLLRQHDDLVFLMIGNGPERDRMISLAKELQLTNMIFSQSPYEEMDSLYSVSYASIATLRNMDVAKGMRLSKIFPALSCGVPVIYAGHGEAADLLRKHECGIAVTPENPDLLASAIQQLALDQDTRDKLGRAGRQLVESEYSWKAIVARWLRELTVVE